MTENITRSASAFVACIYNSVASPALQNQYVCSYETYHIGDYLTMTRSEISIRVTAGRHVSSGCLPAVTFDIRLPTLPSKHKTAYETKYHSKSPVSSKKDARSYPWFRRRRTEPRSLEISRDYSQEKGMCSLRVALIGYTCAHHGPTTETEELCAKARVTGVKCAYVPRYHVTVSHPGPCGRYECTKKN